MIVQLALVLQVCVPTPVKIQASDGIPGDHFGSAVDLQGSRLVVGAENRELPSGARAGSAYVYDIVAGSWVLNAILEPASGEHQDEFGWAVACAGDRVVVGAPRSGPRGQVFVYHETGGQWVEETVISPSVGDLVTSSHPRYFGFSLSLDGAWLFVGVPSFGIQPLKGSVYVYERVAATWLLRQVLQAADGTNGNEFGYSVLQDGDRAFVGAIKGNGNKPQSGAVYVFTRQGALWSQQQKLTASDGEVLDRFGFSLALDGNALVVGAPWRDAFALGDDSGGAYVFAWNGAQWQEHQFLLTADYNHQKLAGNSLAMQGEKLVMGASWEWSSGTFHLFSRSGAGWSEHVELAPPGSQLADQVAWALSIEGDRLVVGSIQHDGLDLDTGAVHEYDLGQFQSSAPTYYCTAKTDSKGCTPRIQHTGLPSVSGAAAGESHQVRAVDVRPFVPAMLVYSLTGAASSAFSGGLLCAQPPIRRTAGITTGGHTSQLCSGHPTFDLNAWIAGGQDPALVAGQPLWMQFWYRDQGGPPGQEVGLSDAIHVQICP